MIGYPANTKPEIQEDHIDGPLLHFRDGQLHWLTYWERFLLWLGLTDAKKLEQKLRPELGPVSKYLSFNEIVEDYNTFYWLTFCQIRQNIELGLKRDETKKIRILNLSNLKIFILTF